jgi:hypothetical protein
MLSLEITKAYDTCWRYARVGYTFSTKMNIENGIVHGAVISVALFLIAMTDICKEMEKPRKMIGYADDWIIYTSHKLPRMAEARLIKYLEQSH